MKGLLIAIVVIVFVGLVAWVITNFIAPDKMNAIHNAWNSETAIPATSTTTATKTSSPTGSDIPWADEMPSVSATPSPTPTYTGDYSTQLAVKNATIDDLTKKNEEYLKAIRDKESKIVEQETALENLSSDMNKIKSTVETQLKQIKDLEKESNAAQQSIPAPKVVEQITQVEVMDLLRETFPNARIRGPERQSYALVNFAEIQRFLKNDTGSDEDLGEDSDYIVNLMGALKQPGWSGVPIGYVKKTSATPVYGIVVAEDLGEAQVYFVDILEDDISPIGTDKSVEFVVAIF